MLTSSGSCNGGSASASGDLQCLQDRLLSALYLGGPDVSKVYIDAAQHSAPAADFHILGLDVVHTPGAHHSSMMQREHNPLSRYSSHSASRHGPLRSRRYARKHYCGRRYSRAYGRVRALRLASTGIQRCRTCLSLFRACPDFLGWLCREMGRYPSQPNRPDHVPTAFIIPVPTWSVFASTRRYLDTKPQPTFCATCEECHGSCPRRTFRESLPWYTASWLVLRR